MLIKGHRDANPRKTSREFYRTGFPQTFFSLLIMLWWYSCHYYVYIVYCKIYLYIGNNYNNQDSQIFFSGTIEEGKGDVEGFKVPEF